MFFKIITIFFVFPYERIPTEEPLAEKIISGCSGAEKKLWRLQELTVLRIGSKNATQSNESGTYSK